MILLNFSYRLLLLVLSLLIAVSCQLPTVLPPTQFQHPQTSSQTASFSVKSESVSDEPQELTLPSKVIHPKLTAAPKPLKTGKWYKLHFSTAPLKNPAKPKHIQISEQGSIQLTFQVGPEFKLLDADARDGQARVQLPESVYQGYLRLAGEPATTSPRSLVYEDPLFYLQHSLGRNDGDPQRNGSFGIQAQNANKLQITSRCSSDPSTHRIWQIHNPASTPVTYTWEIKDSEQAGTEVAPPGDSYLETDTEDGKNTLQIQVNGKKEDSLASKADTCALGQEPESETSIWWNLGTRSLPIPSAWKSTHGNQWVLQLNNQGITDFTMRWVKTPEQTAAFPPGIKEIGPAGGTVELPGVGKIELPAGALTAPTVISLHEELQVKEILGTALIEKHQDETTEEDENAPEPPQTETVRQFDFASSVMRVEPLNLALLVPAKVSLETDLARLGNNHPSVMVTGVSPDKETWGYLTQSENDSLEQQWTSTFSVFSPILGYFSRQIPGHIVSDLGIQVLDSEIIDNNGFQIKSDASDTSNFRIFYTNSSKLEASVLAQKLEIAYSYYTSPKVAAATPNHWYQGKIPVFLNPYEPDLIKNDASGAFVQQNTKFMSLLPDTVDRLFISNYGGVILVRDAKFSAAHELWHLFQFTALGESLLSWDLRKNSETAFLIEGPAVHMAAAVHKNLNSNDFQTEFETYQANLDTGITAIELSLNRAGKTPPYQAALFFTYLAHPDTGLGREKVIANLASAKNLPELSGVINTLPSHWNKFAKHAYLKDRFNYHTPSTSVPVVNKEVKHTNLPSKNPLKLTDSIPLLAAKYFKIKSNDSLLDEMIAKDYGIDLVFKLKSSDSCSAAKFTVLEYKGTNLIKEFDLSANVFVKAPGFKSSFDSAILIASNGSVSKSCSPEIEVSLSSNPYIKSPQHSKKSLGQSLTLEGAFFHPTKNANSIYLAPGDVLLENEDILNVADDGTSLTFKIPEQIASRTYALKEVRCQSLLPGEETFTIASTGSGCEPSNDVELEIAPPERVQVQIADDKLFIDGSKWKDVFITIQDELGNPVPDGSTFYVGTLQENGAYGAYEALKNPQTGYIWYSGGHGSISEGAFTVQNGQIHLQYTATHHISKNQYDDNWPSELSPSVKFRVCDYGYSSYKPGWGGYCVKQLYPSENTPAKAGRIYFVDVYSAELQPSQTTLAAKGQTIDFTVSNIKDRAGNTVPDGRPIYIAHPRDNFNHELLPADNGHPYISSTGRIYVLSYTQGGSAYFSYKSILSPDDSFCLPGPVALTYFGDPADSAEVWLGTPGYINYGAPGSCI